MPLEANCESTACLPAGLTRSLPALEVGNSDCHENLIAGSFGCRCRFGHSFAHLCLNCIEIKARAALHRRVIKERLELLSHQLLNEYEAPELVFEPIKVLLSPLFCPVAGPARTFKWIEA